MKNPPTVVYRPSHYLNPSVRRGDLRPGQYLPLQFVESALEGNGMLITSGKTKHRLFMLVLVIAIVLAMSYRQILVTAGAGQAAAVAG